VVSTVRRHWAQYYTQLSTSAKLILILSLALAPLGVIALLASLQSARMADAQRRSELRVAATEATRKLATELSSDIVVLRDAGRRMDSVPNSPEPCTRVEALLSSRGTGHVPFALFGVASAPLCATAGMALNRPASSFDGSISFRTSGDMLDVIVPSPAGSNVAVTRYTPQMLARFAEPAGYGSAYRMTIDIDGAPLVIAERNGETGFDRTESVSMPVGVGPLSLSITVASAQFGAAEALLTFLPLLMWASASAVGFYVVDRLLIRPLKVLRASVATYEPGSSRRALTQTPAIEIRELETSFAAFADRLAEREHDLERALSDQVRLTREVHHRVKNNLQVIASLISLHARDSVSSDAELAYASIQRRVDALAIVHRNHYAELEQSHGIDAKALLSELIGNFRANPKPAMMPPTITLAASPLYVTQDTAIPLAFLFTEIAELALFADPTALLAVTVVASGDPGAEARVATLDIASAALRPPAQGEQTPAFRIIEGLARQLRAPMKFDSARHAYTFEFATLGDINFS
jgi:hypothetical protein